MPKIITDETRDRIMALTRCGRTNKEIAAELGVSKTTIQKTRHLFSIASHCRADEVSEYTQGNSSARDWANDIIKESLKNLPSETVPLEPSAPDASEQDYRTKYRELVRSVFLLYNNLLTLDPNDYVVEVEDLETLLEENGLSRAFDEWSHRLPEV